MIRSWLIATTALAMMTGVAVAQTSSSSTESTRSTTSVPSPAVSGSSSSSSERTVDSNGVVVDQTKTYTKGTTVSPGGDTDTTRKTTNTTTVH